MLLSVCPLASVRAYKAVSYSGVIEGRLFALTEQMDKYRYHFSSAKILPLAYLASRLWRFRMY